MESLREFLVGFISSAGASAALLFAAFRNDDAMMALALSPLIGVSMGLAYRWTKLNPGPVYLGVLSVVALLLHVVFLEDLFGPGLEEDPIGFVTVGVVAAILIPMRR